MLCMSVADMYVRPSVGSVFLRGMLARDTHLSPGLSACRVLCVDIHI